MHRRVWPLKHAVHHLVQYVAVRAENFGSQVLCLVCEGAVESVKGIQDLLQYCNVSGVRFGIATIQRPQSAVLDCHGELVGHVARPDPRHERARPPGGDA